MRTLAISLLTAASLLAAEMQIPIEKYELKNGLRVVLSQDTSSPVVAVYVIYHVGARSEEKGRTGFAHLFEHMMFQGSKNVPKGEHFKVVEANGGWLNGSTHPDYTDYFEMLPANKLALGLWLESDRMSGLNITEENLKNQKEAVKQERRLSFDNQPYATAVVDVWPQVAFENWSNSHSLIGSFEDLDAATVEDVRKFFKTYYAPNNAALVVVGDINIPEAKNAIERYFGDIPPQPQPKRPDLTESEKTAPRFEVYQDRLAQVPALIVGWMGPKHRSPDYYSIVMLDALLTGGDSSRFQQDLVKGKQSIIQYEANLGWPFAGPPDYVDPGMYAMNVLYKPNYTGKQILAQVQDEIDRIQKDGVTGEEMDRVRTFVRSARYSHLQPAIARAQLLGQYEVLDNDPSYINTELDKLMAVTPEQVQEVARKYLVPDRRKVLNIVPAAAQQPATQASQAAPESGKKEGK